MDALSIAIGELEREAGEAGCDNGGRDVARYFGQPFREGKNYGNWCAAFVSWCLVQSGVVIDDPRARRGAKRLVRYVASRGTWVYAPSFLKPPARFNLGQVIDSSGLALLTMLEKEQPAIIAKFKLGTIRTDLATAQTRRAALQKKASLTPAETAESH